MFRFKGKTTNSLLNFHKHSKHKKFEKHGKNKSHQITFEQEYILCPSHQTLMIALFLYPEINILL